MSLLDASKLAVCQTCPQRSLCRKLTTPGSTCEHWPQDATPGIITLATRAVKEVTHWAAQGAPVVDDSELTQRRSICGVCPHWQVDDFAGKGRCGHGGCGCSGWKLHLATSVCPMGKWGGA